MGPTHLFARFTLLSIVLPLRCVPRLRQRHHGAHPGRHQLTGCQRRQGPEVADYRAADDSRLYCLMLEQSLVSRAYTRTSSCEHPGSAAYVQAADCAVVWWQELAVSTGHDSKRRFTQRTACSRSA